jgi:hypothetical protein
MYIYIYVHLETNILYTLLLTTNENVRDRTKKINSIIVNL